MNLANNIRKICLFYFLFVAIPCFAQDDSSVVNEHLMFIMDSFDHSVNYQSGKIPIKDIAVLDIPEGFKYIPPDKAEMIIHDIWNNPKSDNILGMIVRKDFKVYSTNTWAFVITYSEDGYVKDEDADKIDYNELLKKIQGAEEEENKERVQAGYPPIHLAGWAAKPFYDKEKKVLHWAKDLEFGKGDTMEHALNYDVRVLGRKGILSLNAVGALDQLADIDSHIPDVLNMAHFTEGNKYKDFNPSMDKVAAYTIGGLIAGKLIAKTGLFILLLKNIKLLLIGFLGGFAAFRKKIAGWFSRRKNQSPDYVAQISNEHQDAPAQNSDANSDHTTNV